MDTKRNSLREKQTWMREGEKRRKTQREEGERERKQKRIRPWRRENAQSKEMEGLRKIGKGRRHERKRKCTEKDGERKEAEEDTG